jgi:hypothetical protein
MICQTFQLAFKINYQSHVKMNPKSVHSIIINWKRCTFD